jgi:hypothetical protein
MTSNLFLSIKQKNSAANLYGRWTHCNEKTTPFNKRPNWPLILKAYLSGPHQIKHYSTLLNGS